MKVANPPGSELRRALYHLLTVMTHGERVAMEGASLQACIAPTREVRLFLRRQARHERFHALVFAGAAAKLSPDTHSSKHGAATMPPALSDWRAQIVDAVRRGRLAESLLVQQVYLEGLGHVLLRRLESQLAEGDQANSHDRLVRLRRLILRQEQQHHTFGLRLLDSELLRDPAVRPRLEKIGRSLFGQAEQLLASLADSFDALDWHPGDTVAELRAYLPAGVPGVAA